jgi:quinone-modifying oxidoreductase subunit QmoA
VGYEVFLVEKNPYLGGRVAQLNQYFPKLCPPTCGLEINFSRIKDNPRIKVMTLAEVTKVDGAPGNYDVRSRSTPATSTKTAPAAANAPRSARPVSTVPTISA